MGTLRVSGWWLAVSGVLLSGLLLTVLPAETASAAWPGADGAIAFQMRVEDCRYECFNYDDIFLTDPAGSEPPVGLPGSTERYDEQPDWSPDGNRIAFEGYPYGGYYVDIYTMAADGSDLRRLTNDHTNQQPRWSPDGRTIAFIRRDAGGIAYLWVMDSDGSDPRAVPIDNIVVGGVGWLPDGRISFWGSGATYGDPSGLYVTDTAGTTVDLIVSEQDVNASGSTYVATIDWAPDGSLGVFTAEVPVEGGEVCNNGPGSQRDVWTVTQGGVLARVAATAGVLDLWEADPVWSPSGDRIAFNAHTSHCEGEGRDQSVVAGPPTLYTMAADGTDLRQVLDPPSNPDEGVYYAVGPVSWQPCTDATTTCGRPEGEGGYPIDPDGEPSEPPPGAPTDQPPGEPADPPGEPTDPPPGESTEGPFDDDATSTVRMAFPPVPTAVEVSRARFAPDVAAHVVLSRDDTFPDSLAGSSLTGNGPLLFTPTAALSAEARAEVDRVLAPGGTVYLLGGTAALSDNIAAELQAAGYVVQRLSGPSRVETAVAVATEVRWLYGSDRVGLARADGPGTAGWADSVTGGGWAASAGVPILITQTGSLHPAVSTWLDANPPAQTVLFGGTAALSDAVMAAVPSPLRVSGSDRAITAAAIARQLWGAPTTGPRRFVIIHGYRDDGWQYGLAAGGLAADSGAPLLMVNTGLVPDATAELVRSCGATAEVDLVLMGTTDVIDSNVATTLDELDPTTC